MVTFRFWLLLGLLIQGIFSQDTGTGKRHIQLEKGDHLHVKCIGGYTLKKKNDNSIANNTELLLRLWDDPRGVYYCEKKDKPIESVQVYVRRCMNCIELDPTTIAGFIVADAIMIGLIATAVYFVSGSETRRPGRASDKQNLIERDTEYQVLGRRDNEQYSHLAPRPKRGGF
ncbi:T-cell surface glycoprotein CD3 gamma chain-like isoform X2 [Hyla sarda]|uniref:T-cell surface glycoprotein CD3 gamma chain-like isoform X2 n=1 Tax=Hyla sarda TaxID=327740 RepID=UPI0024C32F3C|nr:T-cell surface glycoprotein CD3 gamma chain-like isoform X2 [Hyla sarda]